MIPTHSAFEKHFENSEPVNVEQAEVGECIHCGVSTHDDVVPYPLQATMAGPG